MLAAYERGKIVHVLGTRTLLERALRRFPLAKPFDLTDAGYWAWDDLTRGAAAADVVAFYRKRAEERAGAEQPREQAGELRCSR
jgi:hypothetical protein